MKTLPQLHPLFSLSNSTDELSLSLSGYGKGLPESASAKGETESKQHGYTLVEVLVVVAVVCLLATITLPRLNNRNESTRLLNELEARVWMRRAEALHLRPMTAPTMRDAYTQTPITIDFARLESTAPLRLDGTDKNSDDVDDQRGVKMTSFNSSIKQWNYIYEGAPLSIPNNWHLAGKAEQLPEGVELIKDAQGRTRGIPASAIGFDASGQAWADCDGDGIPESAPDKLTADEGTIPFWAIYFTNGETAIAVAVHATGMIEEWQWTPRDGWRGWRNHPAE